VVSEFKQLEGRVGQSRLDASRLQDVLLIDVGKNGPRDQLPIFGQGNRDNGLEVELVLESVATGTRPEVEIVLEGQTDQRRHRIVQLPGHSRQILRCPPAQQGRDGEGFHEGRQIKTCRRP